LTHVRNRYALLALGVLAAVALILPATSAAAPPALTFAKVAPKTALLGTKQRVELNAENPAGPRGYNLSFRDVLPVGVAYVSGSASVAPSLIVPDKPALGQTTLIFENVSDLSAKSDFSITYEVEPSKEIFKLAGNKNKYTNEAESFISERPRKKPNFSKETGKWLETAAEKAVIASIKKTATTELTAIEIEKSEPSPEGEILRGVHEHQTVYTLTVKNNHVGPTEGLTGQGAVGSPKKSIVVEDWLPAGLEFLGCGKTDNTSNTSTNPGSAEEYPGSGPIDPGHAPATTNCVEPFYVKTETVDPPSEKLPLGVYTHVKWEGPESLATSGEFKIEYVAAIPLRRNATTWLGAEPAAEGGGVKQIANLNNNTGGETTDEEALVNNAQARGRYEATEVKDEDEMVRTAEDLAIQKAARREPPNQNEDQPKIFDGAETRWTLRLEASEYRRSEPVSITDQLPNGLCPIGPKNYEEPTEPKAECAASTTRHPTVKYVKKGPAGKVGTEEQIEYTLAKELSAGGFELQFNGPAVAALSRLEPSQELLIAFPTTTRVFYQNEFKDSKPILTEDSWTNHVSTKAPSDSRCYVEHATEPPTYEADPNCEKPGTLPIASIRPDGAEVIDASEASQEAGGVTIEKSVRKNVGAVPVECAGDKSEYVKGLISPTETALPKYRPGDEICWRLVVRFASNLYAGTPIVSDFIPTDETLVQGSEVQGPDNTIESKLNEEEATKEEALEWTIGKPGAESVENGQIFEVRFRTKVKTTLTSEPGEISGNLMKLAYSNSLGQTFPLRDRAEVERQEPNLELKKKVLAVNGGAASSTVKGGDEVKFGVEIPNTGTLKAEEIEVWDNLPAGIECGVQVPTATISNEGACEGTGRIVWKKVSVAAKATGTLTYVVKIPANVAPGHAFTNTAGVTQFKSETNTGEKFTYVPKENINPAAPEPNTEVPKATATVTTTGATLTKEASTETTQEGNTAKQATIGEIVDYTVTAKVPANSTLYGTPELKDTLPTGLEFIAGTAEAKLGTEKVPTGGFTIAETKTGAVVTGAKVTFPETFATGSTEAKLVLTFKAKVKNIAANVRGVEITNSATLVFKDKEGATAKEVKASVKTPLVEPELKVKKTQAKEPVETVKPGETIAYAVSAEDVAGHSAANNVVLVDSIPLGMKVVGGTEGGVVNGVARTITWELGTVNPGAPVTRNYTLEIESPAKSASVFKNKVVGTTQSLPPEAGSPGRTATFEEAAYKAAASGYQSSAEKSVRLIGTTIAKEVSPPEGTIGTPLRYTLRLKLLPGIKYSDTTVVDTLPDGVAFDRTISTEIIEGVTKTPLGEQLTENPEGTPQRVGWYFGNIESASAEREAVVVFEAHIKGKKTGGAEIKSGAELTNSVTGLYNSEPTGRPTTVPIPGPESGFTEQTAPATALTKVAEPAVTVAKSVRVEPGGGAGPKVQPGGSLLYKVVVTNSGNWSAYDVAVTDTNPQADLREITPLAGAGFVKTTAPTLSWVIPGPIAAGASVELTYSAKLAPSTALQNGDAIDNIAAVPSYHGIAEAEQKPKVEYRPYKGNESPVALNVALPELELIKTAGPEAMPEAEAKIGKAFAWQIEVKNKSTVAEAKAVNVFDALPTGWAYVAGSSEIVGTGLIADPTPVAGELEWATSRTLAPGGSFKLTFKATPTSALIGAPGVYTNKARTLGEDASGSPSSGAGPYEAKGEAKAILRVPGLAITKTPDEGPAVAGDPSAYTIAIENSGESEATEVEVSDVLDGGNEYAAGAAFAEPATGFEETGVQSNTPAGKTSVHWKIASIPAAVGGVPAKVTIHVPVTIGSTVPDGTTLGDEASVKSSEQPVPAKDKGSLIVSREADLSIEKTTTLTGVVAGEGIEYQLHVKNLGPSEAEDAVVKDPIPAGMKFVTADSPCTEAAGGTEVVCELGDLPANFDHEYSVDFEVLPSTTGSVVNKATIASPTDDPNENNNKAEKTTPVEPEAELHIVKKGPSQPLLLGSTFGYEIEVENKGPSDAVDAEVIDPLPPEVELVSAEAPCEEVAAGEVACELGTLVPGQLQVLHFTVKLIGIPAVGGQVVNIATVTSTTPPAPGSVEESEAKTTVLPAADLAITKSAPATVAPDGELAYKLHVENLGPSVAHGVTVTDPLPAGVDFVSAGAGCSVAAAVVTCVVQPGGELAVGEAVDFTVTVHVPFALGGQPLVNSASVKGEEGDPNTENDQNTVTTTVGPAADLSITKTMGKAEAGKPLTYTLAVTDKGPSASSAVTVKDTLPAGTTFKSAAPSQGSCSASGQAITCALGPLAAGASAQVSITVDVGAAVTGSLRNVASVEGPEPDPDKTNNESSVEGPVTPAPSTPTATPTATPNLKVVKSADTSAPQVGTPFDYDVAITNMGGAEAKDVKVVDTLNGPVKVRSIDPESGKCEANGSKITCTIPSIPVGKTVHVRYTVVAEAAGPLSNTASAEAANGEKAPSNNHAVKSVKAKSGKASFTLTKTARKKVVDGGKTVGFTIALRNGPVALVNATVCDRLPAALVFVRAAGASFVKGEACWRKKFVAAHGVVKLHLTARAVRGFKPRVARNVASASAENAPGRKHAAAAVRIKPAFSGAPGGVTG
jgi:large repetitive protein